MLLAAYACAAPPGALAPTGSVTAAELTVFAASSLTDAFNEIGTAFQQTQPGVHVAFNFGASSQLRVQIAQGAHADVFASADEQQMAAAESGGLVHASTVFARNELTIITPARSSADIHRLQDLAKPGVRLVTAQPSVPIGQYTRDLLARAGQDPAYGASFPLDVERNIVSREDNVRQVVGKVQLGEADAAVVYVSDVTPAARPQLQTVPIPDALNVTAVYPIAVTTGAGDAILGRRFVDFVRSEQGQAILTKWGFLRADGRG